MLKRPSNITLLGNLNQKVNW